jgi:hypothetical protein
MLRAHCTNKCLRFDGLEALPRPGTPDRTGAVRDTALPTSENIHSTHSAE